MWRINSSEILDRNEMLLWKEEVVLTRNWRLQSSWSLRYFEMCGIDRISVAPIRGNVGDEFGNDLGITGAHL